MKQDGWGKACGTYWGEGKYIQVFGEGNLKMKVSLENLDVDGRIILKIISKK